MGQSPGRRLQEMEKAVRARGAECSRHTTVTPRTVFCVYRLLALHHLGRDEPRIERDWEDKSISPCYFMSTYLVYALCLSRQRKRLLTKLNQQWTHFAQLGLHLPVSEHFTEQGLDKHITSTATKDAPQRFLSTVQQ